MMKKLFLLLAYCLFIVPDLAAQCDPVPDLYHGEMVYDNVVNAIKMDSNILYSAGNFRLAGRYSGSFTATDTAGNPLPWTKFDGSGKITPDGHAGYIFYGNVTMANTTPCHGLVRVDSSGNLLPGFIPDVVGPINDAVVVNDTLYIVGLFNMINGNARGGVASFDLATGSLLPLNCSVNGEVKAVAKKGDTLYLGGNFSAVNTVPRGNLAAINRNTGAVTSFRADVASTVSTPYIDQLFIAGDTLLLTGAFRTIADSARRNAAGITLSTRRPNSFLSYLPDGASVSNITRYGDTLYFAGLFDQFNGVSQRNLAAMQISSGAVLPLSVRFSAGDNLRSVHRQGNTLYISGEFSGVGDSTRFNMALLDAGTFAVLPSVRDIIHQAWRIYTTASGKVIMAGDISSCKAYRRQHIAAYDVAADTLLPFSQDAFTLGYGEYVKSIEVTRNSIFISGRFRNQNGASPRQNIAAFRKGTGALLPFSTTMTNNANDAAVAAIAAYGSRLYVGGTFRVIGGNIRFGLAALDTATAAVAAFDPSTSNLNSITGFAFRNNTLYLCGGISGMGGLARSGAAAVDLATGLVTTWDPNILYNVSYMKLVGNTVYVFGDDLATVGGQARNGFAAIDATTGVVKPWNPNIRFYSTSGGFFRLTAIEPVNDKIIVAGRFDTVNTAPRYCLAAIDTVTAMATSWHPLRSIPRNLARYGNRLYYSGLASMTDYFPPGGVPSNATGEGIYRFILQDVTPEVRINAVRTALCQGDTAYFTGISSLLSGAAFQWKVNGNPAGINASTYQYVPAAGDVVTLVVTPANTACAAPGTSNSLTLTVTPRTTPSVTVTAPAAVPIGQTVSCMASVTSAGTGYSLDWYLNGGKVATTNGPAYAYVKAAGVDTLSAVVRNATGCYDTAVSAKQLVSTAPSGVAYVGHAAGYRLSWVRQDAGALALIYAADPKQVALSMYDGLGRMVWTHTVLLQRGDNRIRLPDLAPGIYLLTMKEGHTLLQCKMAL